MNISDAERVSAVLEKMNYEKASNISEADLIAIAMCSVRQSAVNRVHGFVQKFKEMKKIRSGFKTILTGCILKKDKKKFANGFDYIVNIKDIKNLPKILGKKPLDKTSNYLDITPKYSSKFSANVPIMTGCNNFCSYCVVPYVREREVSRPAKEIISEIKKLVKSKCKEIWLLGQNVNSYNDGNINFPKLLKMINDIPGNFWIRFTSSHPKDFNSEVINALAIGEKITPYLNLPVQSGDDKVLKLMNRHYTVKDYKNKISALRKEIPDIGISTDIIVGFPGETKKQFENTAQLFRDIKYDMAYINKYSPRAGTAAAKLKDNVSVFEKKNREKVLTEILKQTALYNNQKYICKTVEVLVEGIKNNILYGRTKEYKHIKITGGSKKDIGNFVKAEVNGALPWSLKGIKKSS